MPGTQAACNICQLHYCPYPWWRPLSFLTRHLLSLTLCKALPGLICQFTVFKVFTGVEFLSCLCLQNKYLLRPTAFQILPGSTQTGLQTFRGAYWGERSIYGQSWGGRKGVEGEDTPSLPLFCCLQSCRNLWKGRLFLHFKILFQNSTFSQSGGWVASGVWFLEVAVPSLLFRMENVLRAAAAKGESGNTICSGHVHAPVHSQLGTLSGGGWWVLCLCFPGSFPGLC